MNRTTVINTDLFIEWALDKFETAVVSGDEVKVPDIWWKNEYGNGDSDNKCWINTEKCCFRAFKSERTGHLVEFVMEVEKCSWNEAVEILGGDESIYQLEQKLIEFLSKESGDFKESSKPVTSTNKVSLPANTYLINELASNDYAKQAVIEYLSSRKIDHVKFNLMFCKEGKYRNRIVIPYYDSKGQLLYFNTRALTDKGIRYLGPPKEEFGVGKGDVLWMYSWPKAGSKVYLTEGEFDAMSLAQCGLYAGAFGGKSMSEEQIEFLKPYHLVMAFDADKAGSDGWKVAEDITSYRKFIKDNKPNVSFVRPPIGYKDWNDLLVKFNANTVKAYINEEEKYFTIDILNKWKLNQI